MHQDISEATPGAATVAWAGSSCYPGPLVVAMARTVRRAPRIRLLLTTRLLPVSAAARFEEVGKLNLPTTRLVKTPAHLLRPGR